MFVKYSATGPLCPFRATGVSRPEAHLPQYYMQFNVVTLFHARI